LYTPLSRSTCILDLQMNYCTNRFHFVGVVLGHRSALLPLLSLIVKFLLGCALAAGCWDSSILIWSRQASDVKFVQWGLTQKHDAKLNSPVLCITWKEESNFFTGGCDNKVLMWDLQTLSHTELGAHYGPVKECTWLQDQSLLVTGSWDKRVCCWDPRMRTMAYELMLSERVYSLCATSTQLLVGCAERQMVHMDWRTREQKEFLSPLRTQTRSVGGSLFSDYFMKLNIII
jgi:mRNA export factor